MPYYVQVIKKDTKKVVKQIKCKTVQLACGVESGIGINSKDYRTNIGTKASKDCAVEQ